MKLYVFCILLLTAGGLCKINDSCTVQDGGKGPSRKWTGKCQLKEICLQSGLAAISKNSAGDDLCSDETDDSVQCCVEIKCGASTCRNNLESNPCDTGKYQANFRNQILCPSGSLEDNVQCCIEKLEHTGLKARAAQVDSTSASDLSGDYSIGPSTSGSSNLYASNDILDTPSASSFDTSFSTGDSFSTPFNTNLGSPGSSTDAFSTSSNLLNTPSSSSGLVGSSSGSNPITGAPPISYFAANHPAGGLGAASLNPSGFQPLSALHNDPAVPEAPANGISVNPNIQNGLGATLHDGNNAYSLGLGGVRPLNALFGGQAWNPLPVTAKVSFGFRRLARRVVDAVMGRR